MAMMIKTRGRTPLAHGKMQFGWSKAENVETYSVTVRDETVEKLFTLRMNREEAERLHAWLGDRLEEGNGNNV